MVGMAVMGIMMWLGSVSRMRICDRMVVKRKFGWAGRGGRKEPEEEHADGSKDLGLDRRITRDQEYMNEGRGLRSTHEYGDEHLLCF